MEAGFSGILTSPSKFGAKTSSVDPIIAPAYYEKVTTTSIPPKSSTATVLEFVRTNLTSGHAFDQQQKTSEEYLVTISREELDAKLAQNKAEVESVAAAMKQEMAQWREQNNSQLSALNASIATLSSKIEGKMDTIDGVVKSFDGKVEGIQGQISGLTTAMSGIQSGISTRMGIFGVIIAVVVAIPGLISAIKDSPQAPSPQPVVIQEQQPAPAPAPESHTR